MSLPTDRRDFSAMLDDRLESGVSRVDRSLFTDPDIFALEMERIWEGTWLFVAHESQIANPNDYLTTYLGRQPVVLVRTPENEIALFINACAHRGSLLVREQFGNRADFTCGFHGWCFDNRGELVQVMKEESGGYPKNFSKSRYGLTKVPKLANYRGFIFASLKANLPSLEEHLLDARVLLDMLADQGGEKGLEVIKGVSTYTYDGNWKLQAENGVDGYHVQQVHLNFALTTGNREKLRAKDNVKAMAVGELGKLDSGFFAFGNGHTLLWGDWPNRGDRRPNFHMYKEWDEKFGPVTANWMIGKLRNLLLYPNVFIMDQMSTQIRIFRPLAVDKTEVTVYSIAPIGEDPANRAHRIRQYEDFFNASGMATPDDLSEFNASQEGYQGKLAKWNDLSRGLKHLTHGPNQFAREINIDPLYSGNKLEDEAIFLAQHQHWLEIMNH